MYDLSFTRIPSRILPQEGILFFVKYCRHLWVLALKKLESRFFQSYIIYVDQS